MMITNFGSCCIDNVYTVPYFVKPGETLPCIDYQVHPGGKGLNQSLAMAHAGAKVRHAGKIGADGRWMKQLLDAAGVDTSLLAVTDAPSGHAVIQVTPEGNNAIVIHGGANRTIGTKDIERVLASTRPDEYLLIQNEISCLPELIERAHAARQRIVFNAAPITAAVNDYPLDRIELFIVNEVEAEALTNETEPEAMLSAMVRRFPGAATVLTLGARGAVYAAKHVRYAQPGYRVEAVDTTGAGDTFTGYFLAAIIEGRSVAASLNVACRAAAVCVTRPGAASSIPDLQEVLGAQTVENSRST